eukprot:GHVU01212438.1.p1 GENE.GHVU01212438.1~~GHVU01212438.1.p1  ORF type:complete len:157 (+),score=19.57 GHVU01212438.1:23-472(+)
MAEAAERMGQAARRAEETGEVIRVTPASTYGAAVFSGLPANNSSRENHERSFDYRGEVRRGHADGLGVERRLEDGSVWYEGELQIDLNHGLGVMRYLNGNIDYAGQWEVGGHHGLGVKRDEDGSVNYAGWWNRGKELPTAPPGLEHLDL